MKSKAEKNSSEFGKQVQTMFSSIAPRYDFLNALLSLGRDSYWRKRAINTLAPQPGERFLDLATGTCDLAIEIAPRHGNNIRVFGADFSLAMLKLGKQKVDAKSLQLKIDLLASCAEQIPFADGVFHGVVTAFGIRNFSDPEAALQEMRRVLRPKGRMIILEFSPPPYPVFREIFAFYFQRLLPWVGGLVSGHKNAYSYLPQSVAEFPHGDGFVKVLESAGFKNISYNSLTLGIVTIYVGYKNG